MYADAALVVRRSPAEQPVAPAGRLETGVLPHGGVTDGLYVVVRVQAHTKRSSRALEAANDGRLAAFGNDLYVGAPQLGEVVSHRPCCGVHVGSMVGLRAHRGDRDQSDDIVDGSRDLSGDSGSEIGHEPTLSRQALARFALSTPDSDLHGPWASDFRANRVVHLTRPAARRA